MFESVRNLARVLVSWKVLSGLKIEGKEIKVGDGSYGWSETMTNIRLHSNHQMKVTGFLI